MCEKAAGGQLTLLLLIGAGVPAATTTWCGRKAMHGQRWVMDISKWDPSDAEWEYLLALIPDTEAKVCRATSSAPLFDAPCVEA